MRFLHVCSYYRDDNDGDDDEGEDDDIIHGPIQPDHLFKPEATKDWERCAVNFYFLHIVYLHKISRPSEWKTFNPLNYQKKKNYRSDVFVKHKRTFRVLVE